MELIVIVVSFLTLLFLVLLASNIGSSNVFDRQCKKTLLTGKLSEVKTEAGVICYTWRLRTTAVTPQTTTHPTPSPQSPKPSPYRLLAAKHPFVRFVYRNYLTLVWLAFSKLNQPANLYFMYSRQVLHVMLHFLLACHCLTRSHFIDHTRELWANGLNGPDTCDKPIIA